MSEQIISSEGRPKRLVYSTTSGQWRLEILRLLPLSNGVLEPNVQRLVGIESILAYLRSAELPSSLVKGAYELIQTLPHTRRSFDAVDGEWMPTDIAPSYVKELARAARDAHKRRPRADLQGVQAELLMTQASLHRLRERVKILEQQLAAVLQGAVALPAAGASVSASAHVGATLMVAPGMAPLASAGAHAPAVAPAERHAPEESSPSAADALLGAPAGASVGPAASTPPGDRADPQAGRLNLPPAAVLSSNMQQLLGDEVTWEESTAPLKLRNEMPGYFTSPIVDDDGAIVGAMLADLKAVVYLGGTMMMLPEAELRAQVVAGKPSEDALAAMSEIFNTLSAPINSLASNPHVRSSELEPLVVANMAWIKKASDQLTLRDNFGGHVYLYAR